MSFLLLLLPCVCNTTPSLCYPLFESTHPSFVRPPKTELTRLKVAQPGKKGEIDDGGRLILSINPKTVSHRSHLFSSLIIIVTKSLSLSLKGENKRRKRVCCDVCVFYLLLKAYKQKGVVVFIICVVRRPKNSFFGVFFQTTHKKTKGKKTRVLFRFFLFICV